MYEIKGTSTIILFDFQNKKTVLFRPFLKGNPLYFTCKNNALTVSTNPIYILHREDISDKVDKSQMVEIFAINPLKWKDSVFCDIDEVEHGEIVVSEENSIVRYKEELKNVFTKTYNYRDEEKSFKAYLTLLRQTIYEHIQPNKKYGIMLSSGMDSTSIAYFVANILKEKGEKLTAYSWTFPNDSADELKNIQLLCDKIGIELKIFNGEEFGMFDNLDNLFLLPHTPFVNSFWRLNEACYRMANEDGIDFLFNGNFADLLFRKKDSGVFSLLKEKEFKGMFERIFFEVKKETLKGLLRKGYRKLFKNEKKECVDLLPWMTKEAKNLKKDDLNLVLDKNFLNYQPALSAFHSGYLGAERYLSGQYNIYRIEPHKNIELMEYSLNFPSHLTYRDGQKKFFVRESMRGLLPKEILNQKKVGLLTNVALMSFYKNIKDIREKIWNDTSAWNFYIKEEWMRYKLQDGATVDNRDLYIIWICLNLIAWLKAIKPNGSLYEQ